jgi:hypothetical protein
MLVYDSSWPWNRKDPWVADNPSVWTQTRGKGLLSVDARSYIRPESVSFAGYSGDTYIYDHYGYNSGPGLNVVTDVRLALEVMPQNTGSLILGLPEDSVELKCVLPVQGSAEQAQVALREVPLGYLDVKLPLDKVTRVEFSRVDYLITLTVAGKEVFRKDMWDAQVYGNLVRLGQSGALSPHTKSGVRIGADRLKAEFPWIRIDRDVYYETDPSRGWGGDTHSIMGYWSTHGGSPFGRETVIAPGYIGPINLNKDQYLAMGDNSPQSSDSRYWGPVPAENLVGKALLVWWYPTRIRFIH